jgi:hypothetical protein
MSVARRKTNPNLRLTDGEPPGPPEPPAHVWVEPGPDEDCVICFLSGRRVRRRDAYPVKLGPGLTRWMSTRLVSDADRRR